MHPTSSLLRRRRRYPSSWHWTHATDELEDGNVIAQTTGVALRIAALKKLILPTEGLLGDIVAAAKALNGGASEAQRPTVPITLFV